MEVKNLGCKFLEKEFVLGIEHAYCQNQKMKIINKVEDSKKLICIGEARCNCKQYDENIE